jgi:hypothetical protein
MTAFNMHDETFDDLYAVQFFQDEPGVAELRYVPGPVSTAHASRRSIAASGRSSATTSVCLTAR